MNQFGVAKKSMRQKYHTVENKIKNLILATKL